MQNTRIIYYYQETVQEYIFRILKKSLMLSVIAMLLLTLVLMEKGKKDLELLEQKIKITETYEERGSVKEELFRYIDTLPLPKEEIESITTKTEEKSPVIQEEIQDSPKTLTIEEKVAGITPTYKVFNTSAYCSCEECCDKTDGITYSENKAIQWHTIATGNKYKIGTIIYIPELADKPNEGWFVVEDRGGKISNDKLDIYMNSHTSALEYGRKNLECYIYEVN